MPVGGDCWCGEYKPRIHEAADIADDPGLPPREPDEILAPGEVFNLKDYLEKTKKAV